MRDYRKIQEGRLVGALLRVPFLTVVDRIYKQIVADGFSDITHAHLAVFRHIDEQIGSRLVDLADEAQMTKQSMSYLVEYLESQGYVERTPDPSDGRARLIRLTTHGEQVMCSARNAVRDVEAEWATFLGQERMEQFVDTLKELTTILEGK